MNQEFDKSIQAILQEAIDTVKSVHGGTLPADALILALCTRIYLARASSRPGIALIAAECKGHISREGWLPAHDDTHKNAELAYAASAYAGPVWNSAVPKSGPPVQWPWDPEWWKPSPNDRVRDLVKAGSLIVAEIDRLLRLKS